MTLSFPRSGDVTVEALVGAPLRLTLDRYLREQTNGSAPMGTSGLRRPSGAGSSWSC